MALFLKIEKKTEKQKKLRAPQLTLQLKRQNEKASIKPKSILENILHSKKKLKLGGLKKLCNF